MTLNVKLASTELFWKPCILSAINYTYHLYHETILMTLNKFKLLSFELLILNP